jgi:hypothetical protein
VELRLEAEMKNDELVHGLIVERAKERLMREHKGVEAISEGDPYSIV